MKKVPYLLVVGDKEVEKNSVSVRARGGKDLGVLPVDKFARKLKRDIENKK